MLVIARLESQTSLGRDQFTSEDLKSFKFELSSTLGEIKIVLCETRSSKKSNNASL